MRVFTSDDFPGHYPVGVAAVIVAPDEAAARALLIEAAPLAGSDHFTLVELDVEKAHAVVLCDGNY